MQRLLGRREELEVECAELQQALWSARGKLRLVRQALADHGARDPVSRHPYADAELTGDDFLADEEEEVGDGAGSARKHRAECSPDEACVACLLKMEPHEDQFTLECCQASPH